MTMPNPVAEVVERLRKAGALAEDAAHESGRIPTDLFDVAADLLERLSRECDTGVPEIKTALGIAHAALTAHNDWHLKQIEPQTIDGMEIVPADAYCDSTLYELTQDALHHVERMEAKLSAAPQPPTVSPDIVALTRERDQAREALAETRDLIEDLADRALEDLKADRERKFDPYDAPDDCESCITVTFGELRKATKRARSVLHPEKEEKA